MKLSNLPPGVTDRMIEEQAGAFDGVEDDTMLDHEPPPYPFWTVAIYLVDRAYGGPEEGGWWYDHGARQDHPLDGVDPTVLLQVAFSEEQAEALRGMAQDALNRTINVGRRDIGSLLSTGRYDAIVYNGYPPTIWPTTRPHYE